MSDTRGRGTGTVRKTNLERSLGALMAQGEDVVQVLLGHAEHCHDTETKEPPTAGRKHSPITGASRTVVTGEGKGEW
jgi:hypothetical protein